MGINAFTPSGNTVTFLANTTAPTPVQILSSTLGGNQYRVIMWKHNCPVEGEIEVGDDEPCSWCSAVEPPKVEDATLLTPINGAQSQIT